MISVSCFFEIGGFYGGLAYDSEVLDCDTDVDDVDDAVVVDIGQGRPAAGSGRGEAEVVEEHGHISQCYATILIYVSPGNDPDIFGMCDIVVGLVGKSLAGQRTDTGYGRVEA